MRELLNINGVDYTSNILDSIKIGRHKLWSGDDSGRLMNGDMSGTLIGIFPKITTTIYPKNQAELTTLLTALDSPSQELKYLNPKTNTLVTLGTYTNDYEVQIVNADATKYYDSVTVSFISRKKEGKV